MAELSETFGEKRVSPQQRQQLIRSVFQRVAPRYDLMNDLMSFGIHRLWKRRMAAAADLHPRQVIVDLAGGTGDVARRLAGSQRLVIVCDPSTAMMDAGRERSAAGVAWSAGVGEALPFKDGCVDTLTIAFGIRNVTHIELALAEIYRVLRPGGRCLCLEFSRPWRGIRPAYELFSRTVIPRLGAWVSGNPDAYRYLVESIRRFPDQEEMKTLMEQAGFDRVVYRNLSLGIACLHTGRRPDA